MQSTHFDVEHDEATFYVLRRPYRELAFVMYKRIFQRVRFYNTSTTSGNLSYTGFGSTSTFYIPPVRPQHVSSYEGDFEIFECIAADETDHRYPFEGTLYGLAPQKNIMGDVSIALKYCDNREHNRLLDISLRAERARGRVIQVET